MRRPLISGSITTLLALIILIPTLVCCYWVSHGDRLSMVPRDEWDVGLGYVDGYNPHTHKAGGGQIYYYGFFRREPKSVAESLGEK